MPLQDLAEGLRVLGFAAAQWARSRRGVRVPVDVDVRPHPEMLPVSRPEGWMPAPEPHRITVALCPVPVARLGDRQLACCAPLTDGKCPLHGPFPPPTVGGNEA